MNIEYTIRTKPAAVEFPEHPMVKQLLAAATLWSDRTDPFATGKEETCRDMALALLKRGDFVSEKQAGYAAKLVLWVGPTLRPAPAGQLLVPQLFAVMQKHSKLHVGHLKIARKNQDTLCWLMWDDTCVGKLEDGKVVLFSGRIYGSGTTVIGLTDLLVEFEAAPLDAAVKYGKLSGCCCSCGRDLTDPVSIEAGIGPVCAQKFN